MVKEKKAKETVGEDETILLPENSETYRGLAMNLLNDEDDDRDALNPFLDQEQIPDSQDISIDRQTDLELGDLDDTGEIDPAVDQQLRKDMKGKDMKNQPNDKKNQKDNKKK